MRFNTTRNYKLPHKKKPVVGVVKLEHKPFSKMARVTYPDGENEYVWGEDFVPYLEFIGVKDADNIGDKVWNWYKLSVKIDGTKIDTPIPSHATI